MTKLQTEAGFLELISNPFVQLIPCRAFELEPLDDVNKRGVLTIDGEAVGGGGGAGGGRLRVRGEVAEKSVHVLATS